MSKRIVAKLGHDLHPAHVARIIAEEEKQTRWVLANKIVYPDPRLVHPSLLLPSIPDHFAFPSEHDNWFAGPGEPYFRRNRRDKGRGKGQGNGQGKGGKSKGKGKQLPNPALVHKVVAQMLSGVSLAGLTGNLRIFETNIENANASKINFFSDSYIEIGTRCHAWLIEEADGAAAKKLAQLLGYKVESSDENSRGQAIHILWNDGRLEQIGSKKVYDSIARVQGIPDLRPALRVDFRDKVTGKEFALVVLHLKSMRGGPKITSVVRHKQFTLLAQDLGTDFKGIVGGDMNFPLNNAQFQDADPMYKAGYTLVAETDAQATQIIGSRIDGFFERGLSFGVDLYKVFAYFTQIGRSFTDHASLSIDLLVDSKAGALKLGATANGGSEDELQVVGGSTLPVLKVEPVYSRQRKLLRERRQPRK